MFPWSSVRSGQIPDCLKANSIEHSPSWKADQFSASQEIPRLLWKPKVHYHIQNCPNLSLSWASSIQSTPPYPTPWRSTLLLSSHRHLGLPSGFFPSGFPTKHLYTPLLSPTLVTCLANLILIDLFNLTIFGEQYRSLSSLLCSFLHSPVIPLRTKYSPQHPILKHPQPTFLPQCERPSLTPIPNNKQNYISVYLNL